MTQEGLQRALVDLGWITLIHRALGGKPSSSYALYQIMRSAGRVVTHESLLQAYHVFQSSGGALTAKRGTPKAEEFARGLGQAMCTRICRIRDALGDIGVTDAITAVPGVGYTMTEKDRVRVEAALLEAAGFELEAA